MNVRIKRAMEVTRPLRSNRSKGMDGVCRELATLTGGKRSLEAQIKSCKYRMRAIQEALDKIYQKEIYLLDCLKQGKMPQRPSISDNGNGNEQHTAPETPKKEGKKEVVFRF
ncbi:MAG: hypothetical protein Q6359_10275 [Candidatus Brocadiales bacterium]|nr:hypothetical protein [Candidatus Brocadiales bacterium]